MYIVHVFKIKLQLFVWILYAYSVPESSESIICILYLYTVIQIPFKPKNDCTH